MPENKKLGVREVPNHNIHVNASTEDRSLAKDLVKSAMEEIVIPKTTEVVRDTFLGMIGMLADTAKSMVDKTLYPNGNLPNKKPSSGSGYYQSTNYTSYSRPIGQYQPTQQPQRGRDLIGQRPGNQVKYIWVESEEKAKMIVGALKEDIDNYGYAKVATLYEMTRERTTSVDFTYGWTDSSAIGYYYDNHRGIDEFKWFIDLPQPVKII